MFAQIFVPLFFLALIAILVATSRSSSKQRRFREGPSDLRRADDAERAEPYDARKAYRAAQDAIDSSEL
jgi:hypothetical protein